MNLVFENKIRIIKKNILKFCKIKEQNPVLFLDSLDK